MEIGKILSIKDDIIKHHKDEISHLKQQLQEGAEIIRCLLLFDIHECETKNMANRFIEQIKTIKT